MGKAAAAVHDFMVSHSLIPPDIVATFLGSRAGTITRTARRQQDARPRRAADPRAPRDRNSQLYTAVVCGNIQEVQRSSPNARKPRASPAARG
jgi:hypothetical protein